MSHTGIYRQKSDKTAVLEPVEFIDCKKKLRKTICSRIPAYTAKMAVYRRMANFGSIKARDQVP
jgi:hypothetical protein